MTALAASLLASATLGLVSAQAEGPSRVDTVRRTFPAVASRLAPREAPAATRWSDRGRPVDGWRGAHVRLPRLASDPQVAEGEGVTIVRRPRDARAVPAAESAGHLVYADAWPHTDVLQATGPEWTEELLHLRSRRAPREFAYELQARGVAKVGIEDGAVRFLDASGRGLVLTRPVVIDAAGRRSATAARWILAPPGEGGSRRLTLRLDPVGLDYPLLVDPAWIPTGSLSIGRRSGLGILLQTGKVLVMGGELPALGTAELYDPATGRWSGTASLGVGIDEHAGVLLRDGRVLVTGGRTGSVLSNSFLYDPGSGAWAPAAFMNTPRSRHTLTLLPNGRVLAVGGFTTGLVPTTSAEIYDPVANTWTPTAAATVPRHLHAAVLLRDGRVLVCAGIAPTPAEERKAEIFDPGTGTWSPVPDMSTERSIASATLLPDGRVLLAGGNGRLTAEVFDPATGLWSPTGPLSGERYYHSATLLPSGKVIVTGGYSGIHLATTEIYDPATGQWSAGPSLAAARRRHSATMLPDGRVLVAGGEASLATAELLEIDAPSWAPRAPLTSARSEATATLLKNGKVLVAGGVGLDTATLYDPATNTWVPTGNTMSRARSRHAMVTLVNGQVLVVGGQEDPTGSADIYDPPTDRWAGAGSLGSGRWNLTATLLPCGEVLEAGGEVSSGVAVTAAARFNPRRGLWVPTGVMSTPRTRHTATLLKDGRVLVTGGFDGTAAVASAETYDPATGAWSPTAGAMSIARRDHTATLLPSGKVLVTGGFGGGTTADVFDPLTGLFAPTGSTTFAHDTGSTVTLLPNGRVLAVGGFGSLRKAEVYDPAVGTWSALPPTAVERNEHVAALLPDGRVLVAGGGLETSVEVYDAGRGELPAWRPATATWTDPLVTPAPFTVTGSGFQGLGEGSTGVGWMQSATNYPLVQVRRLENELVTWLPVDPGAGWSGTSFRSLPVNGVAPGLAAVTVFTNGIPSGSRLVTIECPPPTVTGSPTSQSVCQADAVSFTVAASGDCPTFQWSRDGAPILEGGRFTGTRATTLSITNVQPADAGAYKATVALACSSTVVESASATLSVTASLSGVTAALSGPATVCSTCLGGTASESHVAGGSVARQWGYRTTSGGPITDIPGATAAGYVLNGTDFPGTGGYFLVVRVSPACGAVQVSNELAVTVDDSPPPGDVVRFFTVTSRSAENVLEWVNPPAGGTVSIRFNGSSTSCAFPATETDGAPVPGGSFAATGGARERLAHGSLVNTSVYCYSVFYDSGGGWKGPRTNRGRPFDTSGSVKWAFSSGLFSTTPPTVGGAGVIATNNDNVVHAMERGTLGGEWPAGWRPALLGGAVQGRSPVVPIPVGGANPVVFLGAQDGGVYAVNATTGGAGPAPWAGPTTIGGVVQAAPAAIFTAFGGVRDALFVGTRDAGGTNALVALGTGGAEIGRFDNGGGANRIGVISGAAAVDYARKRVYFASDVGGSANTLWCLEIDDPPNPVFKQLLWARALGRITSSPVVRGDRVYVANDVGTLYSIHESGAAGLDRTVAIEPGGVKGFIFPDRSSQDIHFSTAGLVRAETDTPTFFSPKCGYGGGGLAPSPVLFVAALGKVYFGGNDGKLYELDAAACGAPKSIVLGDGTATVGAPSFDLVNGLVHVGTAAGVFYAVAVPLP